MIIVDGVMYQEKRNLDSNLPCCSMCKIPLNKCKNQCSQFGPNYFFVAMNPEDAGKDLSGCIKGAAICGFILAGIITLIIILAK